MNSSIKVVICDDHSLFRQGVKLWLSTKKNIDVLGEVEDGLKLIKYLQHVKPDVILLDINMPVMDGHAALIEIKKKYPNIKVIMLTMNDSPSLISDLLKLGASAFLTKNDDIEEIYKAIVTCHENGEYINQRTSKAILGSLRGEKIPQPKPIRILNEIVTEKPQESFRVSKVLLWSLISTLFFCISIYLYLFLKNNLDTISNFDFIIKNY